MNYIFGGVGVVKSQTTFVTIYRHFMLWTCECRVCGYT